MTKRSETRINKSLLVDISKNGREQMGVTINLSRRGMCIATTEIFRRQSRLQIWIAAADDIYAVTGKVVWHMKKVGLSGEEVPAGIGIRIERAAQGYYKYIATVRKNSFSSPKGRPVC